jgi:hypothetical protein
MGRLRSTLLALLIVALAAGLAVPAASAAAPAAASNNGVFPPWYPPPDSQVKLGDGKTVSSNAYYRTNITPLSNTAAPEITDFGCNYPATYINSGGNPQANPQAGAPIKQEDLTAVSGNLKDAEQYYYNLINDGSDAQTPGSAIDAVPDLGLNTSSAAKANYSPQEAGIVLHAITQYWAVHMPANQRKLVAPSYSPTTLTSNIPVGCDLSDFYSANFDNQQGFHSLISNPMGWVSHLVLYILGTPVNFAYDQIQPYAFAYSFWTPHSERGDMMFVSADFSCQGVPQVTGYMSPAASAAYIKAWKANSADSCSSSGTPLGFSKANLNPLKKPPVWVQWSIFFQWLISATYFIILAGGAIIYMSRADHKSSYTVVQMAPRLVLSIILTVALNLLIGGVISLGNYFVQMMFDMADINSIHGVRDIFAYIGNSQSDKSVAFLGAGLIEVGLMVFAVFYLARFLLFAIWRQVALILLIAIAPFATFCLIHPKLQEHFWRFAKSIIAIAFAPVAMAFILKLGIAINPAISNDTPVQDSFSIALVGGLILLMTFHMMARVPAICKAIVKNRPIGQGAMGKVGGLVKQFAPAAALAGGPLAGMAVAGLGAGMEGTSNATRRSALGMASLIPDQKLRSSLQGAPRSGLLGKAMDSEVMGEIGAMTAMSSLEGGMGSAEKALEAGTLLGALGHGTKALGGIAAGTVLGGAFAGNQRTRAHFKNFERRRYANAGVRPLSDDAARRIIWAQEEAVAKAKAEWDPAQNQGKEFDQDKWLHDVYWASREQGGSAQPRVIRRGVPGLHDSYFIAENWSKHASRPLAGQWRHAAAAPKDAADAAVSGFNEGVGSAAGAAAGGSDGGSDGGGYGGGYADSGSAYGGEPAAEHYADHGQEWHDQGVTPAGGRIVPPRGGGDGYQRRTRRPSAPRTRGYATLNITGQGGLANDRWGREALRFAREHSTVGMNEIENLVGKMTADAGYTDEQKLQVAEGLYRSMLEQGVINEGGEVNQNGFNSTEGREQMNNVDADSSRDNSTVTA